VPESARGARHLPISQQRIQEAVQKSGVFQESVRQELMCGRRGDQRQVCARRDFGAQYATRGKKRERWGFAAESADVWRVHRHRSRVSKLGPKLLNTAQLGGAAVYHPPPPP
jgi:hypothetical protein